MKRDQALSLVLALTFSLGCTGAFLYAASPTLDEKRAAAESYFLKEIQDAELYDQKIIDRWKYNFHNNIYDESLDYNNDFRITNSELGEAIKDVYEGQQFRRTRLKERMKEFH